MLDFLNNLNSYVSRDFLKISKKMKELADNGINDRELTHLEEIKFIRKLNKSFFKKLGPLPEIAKLKSIEKEILYTFNKLEFYPSNDYPLLNQHLEYIQDIHQSAYSHQSLNNFIIFCEKNQISNIKEFKEEAFLNTRNIPFIKFYILATLFSHIDVIINKQCEYVQPICLNELFRYRLNPLTTEIKENKVIFHNKKSRFLLPSRQFLKFLSFWQNYDANNKKFPPKARGLNIKELPKDSPYKSRMTELLRDIENTSELIPIFYEDVSILITGYSPKNTRFDEAASIFSNNFQFHILGAWLIYIFQNILGHLAKLNNEIPVNTLWLDLWDSFLPLYNLEKNADHLIKWPADFMELTKPID